MIRKIHQHENLCICICSAVEYTRIEKFLKEESKAPVKSQEAIKKSIEAREGYQPMKESVRQLQEAIRRGNHSRADMKKYLKDTYDRDITLYQSVVSGFAKHGIERRGEINQYRYYIKGEVPTIRPEEEVQKIIAKICGNPDCGLKVPEGDKYCIQCTNTLKNKDCKAERVALESKWREKREYEERIKKELRS